MLIINPYRELILNGLIGWWPLNEGTGTTALDMSGGGRNGTLTNMESGDWISGGGVVFDGTNEYVTIADNSDLEPSSLTIMHWTKTADANKTSFSRGINKNVVGYNDANSPSYGIQRWPDSLGGVCGAALNLSSNHNYYFGGSTKITTDTWHHIALSWTSGSGKIYLDGSQDGSTSTQTGTLYYDGGALDFGRIVFSNNTYYGAVSMRDVRIYNRVLSAAEIAAIAAGRG